MSDCRHPVFARFYAAVSPHAEIPMKIAKHRDEMLEGVAGRVIEVGCGNGLNFSHYPNTVTEVVALEPEPFLYAKARDAAARAPVAVAVHAARAEDLGFEAASFDAGVTSLVLCSIEDPARALAELFRVIRPGGELRFYEHVRAEDPSLARFQDRIDPVWRWFGGGCRPNRDSVAAIEAAGFTVEHVRRFDLDPNPLTRAVRPHVIGRARRP